MSGFGFVVVDVGPAVNHPSNPYGATAQLNQSTAPLIQFWLLLSHWYSHYTFDYTQIYAPLIIFGTIRKDLDVLTSETRIQAGSVRRWVVFMFFFWKKKNVYFISNVESVQQKNDRITSLPVLRGVQSYLMPVCHLWDSYQPQSV